MRFGISLIAWHYLAIFRHEETLGLPAIVDGDKIRHVAHRLWALGTSWHRGVVNRALHRCIRLIKVRHSRFAGEARLRYVHCCGGKLCITSEVCSGGTAWSHASHSQCQLVRLADVFCRSMKARSWHGCKVFGGEFHWLW